jgi:hypothetical protein
MIRGTTGMDRIIFSRRMTPAQAWALVKPVRIALQRLLDAVGTRDDMAAVGAAINLAWLRCQKIGDSRDALELLERGSDALRQLETRADAGAPYAIDPTTERDPICDAINLYDTILRASSLLQWHEAECAFIRHLRRLDVAEQAKA